MARDPHDSRPRKAATTARARTQATSSTRSDRSSGSVTLAHVAKLAGVAPATVSRVLNRPELVTAATLQQVRQVIEQTGYVPNLLAGGLASSRSKVIGAIVSTISHSIFVDTVQALTDRLAQAGYQVMLGLSGYPAIREDDLVSAMLSRRPEGMFFIGITRSTDARRRLLAARIPVVETWDLTPTPLDMLVGFSHARIGRAVAEYFLQRGFRRIGIITSNDERSSVRARSFTSVLREHGVRDVAVATVVPPSTQRWGRAGLAELLDGGTLPDAVFCSSDTLAQGALAEAASRGIAVPAQLSVMGYGDMEFAADTFPALSSVHIDRAGIGRIAAEALLSRIAGNEPPARIVDVGFELIERASTAPARG